MTVKTLEFLTDAKGHKKAVQMSMEDYEQMQEEFQELQDIIAMERAKKNTTSFRLLKDFIKELNEEKKAR